MGIVEGRNTHDIVGRFFVMIGLAFVIMLFVGCSDSDEPDRQTVERFQAALAETAPSENAILTLAVDSALCVGCAKELDVAVRGIDGVKFMYVNSDAGTAQVFFDPEKVQSSEVILEEFAHVGVPATVISPVSQ